MVIHSHMVVKSVQVLPLLSGVMYNLTPYLRHHSPCNQAASRAGARLLATISEYQYTRKIWKKEGIDLLMEAQFFQMDHASIVAWKTIIDNLMTRDKTTFKVR